MSAPAPRSFLRENALGLFFGAIFLLALAGQALAGWTTFNDDQVAKSLGRISPPASTGIEG